MKIIGLTGGIGSGKSTVSRYLVSLGARVLDADAISHSLTAKQGEALPAIAACFGDAYVRDGELDRKALARLVFSDPERRAALNAILHPMVQEKLKQGIREAQSEGLTRIILDIPLLLETDCAKLVDCVWVVAADPEVCVQRVMARDGSTREAALARIAAQMPLEEKIRRADEVIDNSSDEEKLKARLKALWERENEQP